MEFFEIDPKEQAATDSRGRLKRPWTVFIFAILLSVAFTVIEICVQSTGTRVIDDKVIVGMVVFFGLAVVLSGCYSFIGARYSKRLAQRTVGIAGLVIITGGLAVFVYSLLVLAP